MSKTGKSFLRANSWRGHSNHSPIHSERESSTFRKENWKPFTMWKMALRTQSRTSWEVGIDFVKGSG